MPLTEHELGFTPPDHVRTTTMIWRKPMTTDIRIDFESYLGIGNTWTINMVNETTHLTGSQEHYVGIKCTNEGDEPIKVTSWGFELPNTNYVTVAPVKFPGMVSFPVILNPRKSVNLAMKHSDMAKALHDGGFPDSTPLVGFVREQDGTKHRREGHPFNVY
jgi:hypothetical protein